MAPADQAPTKGWLPGTGHRHRRPACAHPASLAWTLILIAPVLLLASRPGACTPSSGQHERQPTGRERHLASSEPVGPSQAQPASFNSEIPRSQDGVEPARDDDELLASNEPEPGRQAPDEPSGAPDDDDDDDDDHHHHHQEPVAEPPAGAQLVRPSRQSATGPPAPPTLAPPRPSSHAPLWSQARAGAPPAPAATVPTTFDVNMGADRMMIKPALEPARPRLGRPRPGPAGGDPLELATESVNHDVLLGRPAGSLAPLNNGPHTAPSNQRRQDLLYPASAQEEPRQHQAAGHDDLATMAGSPAPSGSQRNADQQASENMPVASICYTPFALLMVILITMLVTVAVCFCTHYVVKYLSRHQFGEYSFSFLLGARVPFSVSSPGPWRHTGRMSLMRLILFRPCGRKAPCPCCRAT